MFRHLIMKYAETRVAKPSIDDVRNDVEQRHALAAGDVAARYTRGNTAIQRGAFQTDDELRRPLNRRNRTDRPAVAAPKNG